MEAALKTEKLVTVTLVTEEGDQTRVEERQIPRGKTEVTVLKEELGVAAEVALWVVRKNGELKQLGDHETHDVKEGDRFEIVVRGGVS